MQQKQKQTILPDDEQQIEVIEREFYQINYAFDIKKFTPSQPSSQSRPLKRVQKRYEVSEECKICCSKINEFIIVNICGHSYHTQCLSVYLFNQIQVMKIPIVCYSDKCNEYFTQSLIRKLVDKETFQKYLKFELNIYIQELANQKKIIKCIDQKCDYVFMKDDRFIQESMTCLCQLEFCLVCMTKKHNNISHKENQRSSDPSYQDQEFKNFFEINKCRMCENCKSTIQKNQGCNHITCRCGHQFCYKCGKKYRTCTCPLYD